MHPAAEQSGAERSADPVRGKGGFLRRMSSQLSQVICSAAFFQGGASECQSGGGEAAVGGGGCVLEI